MTALENVDPTTMLGEALEYGTNDGARIFPANPKNKRPLIKDYHNKASGDPDQIRRWWTQWPDALIAARVPDDMVVIDVDPKHNGGATWEALGGDDIASARRHASGRNDNGRHHWYKRPEGFKPSTVRLDAWARERGLGEATTGGGWTGGIDVLTSTHRYSILPPSLHPDTGQPYWWDAEGEPDELPAILVELLSPPDPKPRRPSTRRANPDDGETPADWFTRTSQWADILNGWTVVHDDGENDGSLWRHPTASAESSASIRHGLLFAYSTNLPFKETGSGEPHGYTKFHAYAVLRHAGDLREAASTIRRTMMPATPATPTPAIHADAGVGDAGGENSPPLGIPTPGDAARLGEAFWQSTAQLAHIAQAADHRVISREAVLLAVLVNVAAWIPAMLRLPGPPRQGAPNLIVITAARPGAGKGSSADCANVLLPPPPTTRRIPLGTAEGFVKTFFELNPDKDERKEQRLVRHTSPVIVRTDEIGIFVQQTGRASASGEGLIAQLKQMCSGEALGFGYATDEKRLMVDPLSYRAGMICGVAPAKAAPLFDDRGGGLPERMVFALAFPEHVPNDDELDTIPPDPGPMQWSPPLQDDGNLLRYSIDIADDVAAAIRLEHLAQIRADHVGSDLDVHRTYNRLRLSVPLAWLHGGRAVTMQWHDMAEAVMASSDAARQWLLDQIADERRRADTANDHRHAARAVTVDEAVATRQEARELERIAKGARRIVELVTEGRADSVSSVRRLMRSFDAADCERALGHAIDNGWITETGEDGQGTQRRALTIGAEVPS